jgi:FKBP-type peptidyl-prolyl cis-trans isomerase SlyD
MLISACLPRAPHHQIGYNAGAVTATNNEKENLMSDMMQDGLVGSIAYKLYVDGQMIEEITTDAPIEYLHGYGNLVPGLEQALEGKQRGDFVKVTVEPEDGFGAYDPELKESIALEDLDAELELEIGMELELMDDEGNVYEAIVAELTPSHAVLDLNPELAGKTLTYEVRVVAIRSANEDELEMGYPESVAEDMFDDDDDDFDDDEDEEEYDDEE